MGRDVNDFRRRVTTLLLITLLLASPQSPLLPLLVGMVALLGMALLTSLSVGAVEPWLPGRDWHYPSQSIRRGFRYAFPVILLLLLLPLGLAASDSGDPLRFFQAHRTMTSATTDQDSSAVVAVAGQNGRSVIAAGAYHNLVVRDSGTVWAWGINSNGELGNGSQFSVSAPIPIEGLTGVTTVAAGRNHSLAVKTDGTVWAWGRNDRGQLGNNSTANSLRPVQVTGLNERVIAVAGGGSHSLALTESGAVWAWGYNSRGQLGNNTTVDSAQPVPVAGLTAGVIAVAAGDGHSVALLDTGIVKTWGDNFRNKLGLEGVNGGPAYSAVPVATSRLSDIVAIAAGSNHSIGLKRDGTVWTWGDGPLGRDTSYFCLNDQPCNPPGQSTIVTDVRAIAGGWAHSVAVKNDGTVWTWGANGQQQLGWGDGTGTPNQVVGRGGQGVHAGVVAVASGNAGNHTLSLKGDGTLWTWGSGFAGALGAPASEQCYTGGFPSDYAPCSGTPIQVLWLNQDTENCVILHHAAPSTPWTAHVGGMNAAFGNFVTQQVDLSLPGRGVPIVLARTYNSADETDIGFGIGWSYTYGMKITRKADNTAVVRHADGRRDCHAPGATAGTYTPPTGIYDRLEDTPDGMRLTTPDQIVFAFDSAGQLTGIADRNGNTTTIRRTSTGITITDPARRTVILAYGTGGDRKHFVSLTESGLRRSVRYLYNADGGLRAVQDVLKNETKLFYDARQRLERIEDAEGRTPLKVVYDSAGRAQSQLDALSASVTMSYNPLTSQTVATDRRSHPATYTFDERYRLTTIKNALDQTTSLRYDANNNLDCVTGLRGKVAYKYEDNRGNVTRIIDARNTDANCDLKAGGKQVVYAYTAKNDIDLATDELGRETDFEYDGRGNLTLMIEAQNAAATSAPTVAYFDQRQLLTIEPAVRAFANGYRTVFEPDPANGDLLAVTDANNHTTTFLYDGYGNRKSATLAPHSNKPAITREWVYDAGSRLKEEKHAPQYRTSYEYYDNNQVKSVTTRPDAGVQAMTTFIYDKVGNRKKVTQPLVGTQTRIIEYDYDQKNNLRFERQMVEGISQQTEFRYDRNDNLEYRIDADGRQTGYVYDNVDRTWKINAPQPASGVNSLTEYAYDDPNGIVTMTDPNLQTTVWHTDTAGRLEQINYTAPNGQVPPSEVRFEYYENGTRWKMFDGTGQTTYAYDERDQLKSVTTDGPSGPQSVTVGYDYDNVGNLTYLTYPGAADGRVRKAAYAYFNDDQLLGVQFFNDMNAPGGDPRATATYEYDAAGRLEKANNANNTSADYVYDDADQLKSIVHRTALNTPITSHAYTPDLAGRRVQADEQIQPSVTQSSTSTYRYDERDQIRQVTYPQQGSTAPAQTVRYTYYPSGNRKTQEIIDGTTTTYEYDGAGRLKAETQTNTATPTATSHDYDANGNLRSRSRQIGVGPVIPDQFAYDVANRMIGATTVKPGTSSTTVTASYAYNGDGVRASSTVDGQTTRFVQDMARGNPVVLFDGQAYYLYSGTLLARIETGGQVQYYHHDGIGSTRAVTSGGPVGPAGTIDAWANYEIFGALRSSTGTEQQALLYAGEWQDKESGLYHLRARQYDPGTGRFTSADPAGFAGGPNQYAYAGNSPTNATDPSGMYLETAIDLASIGYDLYGLATGGRDHLGENLAFLALDVVGAALPVVTGLGAAARVGRAAELAGEAGHTIQALHSVRAAEGAPRLLKPGTGLADHHIIPKFRGGSRYGAFIAARGIDVDQYTVTLAHAGRNGHHLKFIEGQFGWNRRWKAWIDDPANAQAAATDIYRFAGQLMDEAGLSGLRIHPYGQP